MKCMRGQVVVLFSVWVTWSEAASAMRLHGGITAAGAELPGKPATIAVGWSLGQSSLGTQVWGASNTYARTGWWQTWFLLTPPPAPVVTAPVHVTPGTTGYWETAEVEVRVAGKRASAREYPFSFSIHATHGGPVVEVPLADEWRHTVFLEPGDTMITYFSSNGYALSREGTGLKIVVVPECGWSVLVAGVLLLWGKRCRLRVAAMMGLLLWLAAASKSDAGTVFMNYQGVIEMDGGAYHGDGFFKFAIREQGSVSNVWANDGTTIGEPTVSVRVQITNGSFRTVIGGYEMMPMLDRIFMGEKQLQLYVWFGRTSHGPFELIANGEYLYTVPYAANARAVGSVTAGSLTQLFSTVSNQYWELVRYVDAATNAISLMPGPTGPVGPTGPTGAAG
ncbi:MAG: hypothetical protein N2595_02530, partial [bacterium]|nr:hypothetical protein [bacterium]